MKKGLISLDVLIALIMVIFLLIWLENFATYSVSGINSFGVQAQTNALATGIGMQINNFYALEPGVGDYLDLSSKVGTAQNFSLEDRILPQITKVGNLLEVSILGLISNYSVHTNVNYNPTSKKVTES